MKFEDIINYDTLYESMNKCKSGVSWKPNVLHAINNDASETERCMKKIDSGEWKNSPPKEIEIMYPKKRKGVCIPFKDRVYQRAINDEELYKVVEKKLIYANCSCQKGKGTDFARNLLKKYIRSHIARYGIDGYIIQIDIHQYYQSMRHDILKSKFRSVLDDDKTYNKVCEILDSQSEGKVGYKPGSQMIQIAGIFMLSDIDHYIKEKLHVKKYIRYMDDFLLIVKTLEEAMFILNQVITKLDELGFKINEKKTKIIKLTDPFNFMGFKYKVTKTGKIIMTIKPDRVKHERKKLYRASAKAKKGKMPKWKVDQMYESWRSYANKGNSFKMLNNMDKYYKRLWEEEQ